MLKTRRIILTALTILAYSIFLEVCVHLITYDQFRIYDNWMHELINHLVNIAPLFLGTSACTAVVFLLTDRGVFARHFLLKLSVDIVLTAAAVIGSYLLILWAIGALISGVEINYASMLAVYMITLLIIEMIYWMHSSRRASEKAELEKRRALQYQYDAFRAQVNPHFLFNSLNILMDIIENDKDRAGEFTEALSDIYRYVLSTHRKDRVLVSEEMAFLESYIHILTLKYNNFLTVDIHQTIKAPRYVLPFMMQLLLENVTKHNIISDRHPMTVTIDVADEGITVRNPILRKKNSSTGTGLGLKYIFTQYEAAGKSITVSDDGHFFTAKIPYL